MDVHSTEAEDLPVGASSLSSPQQSVDSGQSAATPYTVRVSKYERTEKFHIPSSSVVPSHTFLNAVSQISTSKARLAISKSLFERLPNEILLKMVEYLDIASLVRFAACNFDLRSLVSAIPHVQMVQSQTATSLALSRMLRVGSAKHFTLQDFVDTITSSQCMACGNPDTFAPWMCLLLCERVCGKCIRFDRKSIRLPCNVAFRCFGVSLKEMDEGPGTASAVLQPMRLSVEFESPVGSGMLPNWGRNRNLDIISLRRALKLSLRKHAKSGGASHVKKLVEAYVTEHDRELRSLGDTTTIAPGCHVEGLIKVIEKEWGRQNLSPDWAFMAYVPHLQTKVFPWRFETGLLCEGCERIASLSRQDDAVSAATRAAEDAYLPAQYGLHFDSCAMAQSIAQGEYLTISEQEALQYKLAKASACFAVCGGGRHCEFWQLARRVDFDQRADVVREQVALTLQRIDDLGNQYLLRGDQADQSSTCAHARTMGR
jgi:hypothetical protein